MVTSNSTNNYGLTKFTVDPTAGNAAYTTIQAAINAANAAGGGNVIVQKGTYNENLSLYDKVFISGVDKQNCIINGVHTYPGVNGIKMGFDNLTLTSATDVLTGNGFQVGMTFTNCYFNINGFISNTGNWLNDSLTINGCLDIGGQNGIVTASTNGPIYIYDSILGNAAKTLTLGNALTIQINNSTINCPFSLGNGTSLTAVNSIFTNSNVGANSAAIVMSNCRCGSLTLNNAATGNFKNCYFTGNVSGGGSAVYNACNIDSTATSTVTKTNSFNPLDTRQVAYGGTGLSTTTAYGVICGGTTGTGNFQNAGAGTAGQVLTSNGASALPTWQAGGGGAQDYVLIHSIDLPTVGSPGFPTLTIFDNTMVTSTYTNYCLVFNNVVCDFSLAGSINLDISNDNGTSNFIFGKSGYLPRAYNAGWGAAVASAFFDLGATYLPVNAGDNCINGIINLLDVTNLDANGECNLRAYYQITYDDAGTLSLIDGIASADPGQALATPVDYIQLTIGGYCTSGTASLYGIKQ